MRQILIACALLAQGNLFAQTYVGEASLPPVTVDGFYRIRLTPDVVSCLTPGFANVRITDQSGKEVPYLLDEESPVFSTTSFKEYKMDQAVRPGCCTELVLYNPGQASINNISLQIRNAETVKDASLLGSDDQKQWYALKERFSLSQIDNRETTSEVRILDFPLSNYGFYKLIINDSTTAPLNILTAGYYDVSTVTGRYTEIPKLEFAVTENSVEKQTVVNITLDTTGLFDLMDLQLKGPAFYHRRAELYVRRWIVEKRKDSVETMDWVESFDLTSRQASSVRLNSIRASNLVLVIDNGDNPTLEVQAVRLYQLNRYLVAWLSKDGAYKVNIGKEDLRAPTYDIGYFRDSIPSDPPQLAAAGLLLAGKTPVAESFTLFTSRNFIWVAIVGVIILLAFMTRGMLAKMKQ